jgi:hypothetical protein
VIGAGVAAGQGVIIVSLQPEHTAWLWSAIPACLASLATNHSGTIAAAVVFGDSGPYVSPADALSSGSMSDFAENGMKLAR